MRSLTTTPVPPLAAEPVRELERSTRDECLPGAGRARDDLAGGDPHGDERALGPELEGGPDGAESVVLVRSGSAEDAEAAFARRRRGGCAAVVFDRPRGLAGGPPQHLATRLGVGRLAARERAGEHGDRAPRLAHTRLGRLGPGRRLGRAECGVLAEHLRVQLAERGAGLGAELVDERAAGAGVGVQGGGLAAGPVEGQQELAPEALAEGVLGGERLQLGHELGVAAELEVDVDALLQRGEAQLVQVRGGGVHRLALEVGQGRAAPECQRLAEEAGRRLRVRAARLGDEGAEAVEVELARFDAEQVAGRPALDSVAQGGTQPRDLVLERAGHGGRWLLAPHSVHETPGRHGPVLRQQQQRRQRAPPGAAEGQRPLAVAHLQWTENAELHAPR